MSKFSPEVQAILDRVQSEGDREALQRAGARPSSDLAHEKQRLLDHLDLHIAGGDSAVLREAMSRINRRLNGWMGSGHRTAHRNKYHYPIDRSGPVPRIVVDPTELFIMRLLAQTSPARQYGVSKGGTVFSASTNGYSQVSERIWISGLSRAAEDVGNHYYQWRMVQDDGHHGGRFFERDGFVFDAKRNQQLLRLT